MDITTETSGEVVAISNERSRVAVHLGTGEVAIYNRTTGRPVIEGACLQVDERRSTDPGAQREWSRRDVEDDLGRGVVLALTCHCEDRVSIVLETTLYEGAPFVVLAGGVRNESDRPMQVHDIRPLAGATAFPDCGEMNEMKMLNGPGGAGEFRGDGHETAVTGAPAMESPNNLLVTFTTEGERRSLVLGGLTYHDYAKYASASRIATGDQLMVDVRALDPVGKRVDPGQSYMPDDRFYVDGLTANPFESLERYGLSVRAAQSAQPNIYSFPSVCAWYVSMGQFGGGPAINNSAGVVSEMDSVKRSGFLKYSPVAVRLIPDTYGQDTEQGWWDDAHWRQFGHYVEPYETTEKWARAVTDRGGIPFTYSQTGNVSADYARSHPGHMLFDDPDLLFTDGMINWQTTYDFTDPDFLRHMTDVYTNLANGGVRGIMFDYPESSWRPKGGFDDPYATTAATYRRIFALPKSILGTDSWIHERNVWSQPGGRGCFMDVTAGVVDSQRVWGDTDDAAPEMYARCGLRWYKNRVVFCYDMDAKSMIKNSPANRDGLRQMLTMVYIVSGRLVLSTSFSKMTPEQLHDLSRIYPIHDEPRSARPLDAFSSPGLPRVYDFRVNEDWRQVAFYNDNVEQPTTISVTLAQDDSLCCLGLEPSEKYYVYDFWNDRFVGALAGSGTLEQELRPGEVRMMSVHRALDRPQFISTNRHVMQGYVDLSDCDWNDALRCLSGVSQVVEGDPYEIVIATNGCTVAGASAENVEVSIEPDRDHPGLARLRLLSDSGNREVHWMVHFGE